MKYLLYCDLSTMHCSKSTLEKLLSENSSSNLCISDNLWALDVWEHEFSWEFQGVTEYYICSLLDKYLDKNSRCFILEVNPSHVHYNLPDYAFEFLFDKQE